MTRMTGFLTALFGLFLLSWLGMVGIPLAQVGRVQALVDKDTGAVYPVDNFGDVKRGRQVYVMEGCVNCHTQQVRAPHAGTDIARRWGDRQTVARDFIYDDPLLTGHVRLGPDLANIGARQRDARWHYAHLYDPRSLVPESLMPPFRFLFEKRKIKGQPSAGAVALTGPFAPEAGYEVVPTPDARALVAYLLSLDRSVPLPESPVVARDEGAEAGGSATPATP